ncbi:Putative 3-methyladenine DNA glycosylase [bacterium HR21]|nr:Putative 3-methyladenine DNA glycosylase [bacterium HR21]
MSVREVFEPDPQRALPCQIFRRPTREVARSLLGAILVKREPEGWCAARLVEVEAYLPEGDPANHAFRGKTRRNAAMFEPGGVLYVYAIYGRHRCVNIVTEGAGQGAAVLLRAAEPVLGLELFRRRRGDVPPEELCRGPAHLARAFGFDLSDNFRSICTAELFVQAPPEPVPEELIGCGPRIGVSRGRELLLRFFLRTSACLSGPRRWSGL